MNKFKVGDRVVRLQDNNTSGTRVGDKGTVTNVGENRILVRFDRIGWERANFPENLELEEIWESPLAKALREDN